MLTNHNSRQKSHELGGRLLAIGDIHGHAKALESLLRHIDPRPNDTVVTIGDYVDVGPDSSGVLECLIELAERCQLVPILGNHEEMMLAAHLDRGQLERWLYCGGQQTLASYGGEISDIPASHIEFLRSCRPYFETADHFFIHANYAPSRSMESQTSLTQLWLSLNDQLPSEHFSGRIAIVGHTPQLNGDILDIGHLICVDTGCGYGGRLTAVELIVPTLWQVDESGTSV